MYLGRIWRNNKIYKTHDNMDTASITDESDLVFIVMGYKFLEIDMTITTTLATKLRYTAHSRTEKFS